MKKKYPLIPLKEKDANFFVQRRTADKSAIKLNLRLKCISLAVRLHAILV